MQKIWLWLYLLTSALLIFAFYCAHRSSQLADLKIGAGEIEQALIWSEYGSRSILVGGITGLCASFFLPYFHHKEKAAFMICFICAYSILAVFIMM